MRAWAERRGDGFEVHATEPATTRWQRLGLRLLALLPVDSLL